MVQWNTYETLLTEEENGLATISVNRPDVLNALNTKVLSEMDDALQAVQNAGGIGVLLITGCGRSFVAGADIAQMQSLSLLEGREMTRKGQAVMDRIERMEIPVIAAVNGFALGGGCELAMACDIRFASEKAKFGQPEVNLGITPGFGGTQRLPRLVGRGMAKYLIFSGEIIDALEAQRIGLVEKVFPADRLLDEAKQYARLLLSKSPTALTLSKAAINNGVDADMRTGVAFETEANSVTFGASDRAEGMTAFLEKRPAVFRRRSDL